MIEGKKIAQPRWSLAPDPSPELVTEVASRTNLSEKIVQILFNRNLNTVETIEEFLNPELSNLRDPFELKGMEEGVARLTKAFLENEKVMIYGDYDVDGITATALLFVVLNKLGASVDYYLPNRLVQGYGLSREAIDSARDSGVTLIVTVDTGITAIEEIDYAKTQGLDVVITDHHEQGDGLPNACAIINPKQKGCGYPSELSGVGVAFKLAQALYRSLNQNERELDDHLDLVALGTSADIVPLVGENRILTRFGLNQISRTTKPGLKSLAFVSGLMGKDITTGHIVFILAPRINALGRLGDAREAVRLLSTRDERLASTIARKLDSENKRRKAIDEETLKQAVEQMKEVVDLKKDQAIVLAGEGWHQGVIGIVASRLVETHHLPTVMISIHDGVGKGSARSIPGFHLCEALKKCEHLLIKYGGHKYAAGLSIKQEHVEEFRKKFVEVSIEMLSKDDVTPKLHLDLEIGLEDITDDFVETIERFAPFGPHNMRPVFLTRGCEVMGRPYIVGRNHLRMRVRQGAVSFDVIGYGLGDMAEQISSEGALVDIAYLVEFNTWNNVTRIQIRLKDIKVTVSTAATGYRQA